MKQIEAGPAICDACLGPKRSIRIVRDSRGDACRLCSRPYPDYSWKFQGRRHTRICPSCAATRAACQACMRDLVYQIPLDVRDAALKMYSDVDRHLLLGTLRDRLRLQSRSDTAGETKPKLRDALRRLPFDGPPLNERPAESTTLFIAGIEEDMDINRLRPRLCGSLAKFVVDRQARYALAEFETVAEAEAATAVKERADGVRLRMTWAPPNYEIPRFGPDLIKPIGNAVRKFVRGRSLRI